MNAVLVIARGELRRIFLSPLAWAVLAVVQLILGLSTLVASTTLVVGHNFGRRRAW